MDGAVIPRRFHFVWGLKRRPGPLHLVHYLCLASCLEVNDPHEVKLHAPAEPEGEWWERIRDRVSWVEMHPPEESTRLSYRDRHVRRFSYAHGADFARLDVLLSEGGVYADLDTLFLRRLPEALFEQPFVIGRELDVRDGEGRLAPSLCNAFLMSAPGSRFGRVWRDGMEDAFDGSWSRHSTLLPERLRRELPGSVHVEPEGSFFPFRWTREGIADMLERRVELNGAYSMHLWAHLWWSRRRRDFSGFHAGLIDEGYIRSADTTYAVAARRFLS